MDSIPQLNTLVLWGCQPGLSISLAVGLAHFKNPSLWLMTLFTLIIAASIAFLMFFCKPTLIFVAAFQFGRCPYLSICTTRELEVLCISTSILCSVILFVNPLLVFPIYTAHTHYKRCYTLSFFSLVT